MRPNKILFSSALTIVLLTLALFIVRDLNFHFLEIDDTGATVTINFLLPMDQEGFKDTIKIQNQLGYAEDFSCTIEWLSPRVCRMHIKEEGDIRGQKVQLIINHAPTRYGKLTKEAMIPLQFQSQVMIVEPKEALLISTQASFIVQFNTPMNRDMVSRYLSSDAEFIIEPVQHTRGEKNIVDYTRFKFTPKKPLLNDHKYILTFKKGMPSQSNVMLEESQHIVLQTDKKPIIAQVIPPTGSKWVGLYPRIALESETPIVAAYFQLEGESLTGKMKSQYHVEFYPKKILKPDHTYIGSVQVEAASGELSEPMPIQFTTQPIVKDKYWGEVRLGKNQEMVIYKGEEEIKRIQCSGGSSKTPTTLGTFYLKAKGDKYFLGETQEGSNYWLMLSEQIRIHGMTRNEHWEIKMDVLNRLGEGQTKGDIVMREEDALWLYENLPIDTMIVIHN